MSESTPSQRSRHLRQLLSPLPGSIAQDNVRPLRIPGRMDRWKLLDCVCEMHPPVTRKTWREWFAQGHIRQSGSPVGSDSIVRGGEEFEHVFPGMIEPEVNSDVSILAEDEALVIVDKPAPLPLHASGRFERNTLVSFLQLVYPHDRLRPVHRLDANTSGIVVLARRREAARALSKQFEQGHVRKRYLVRCSGQPQQEEFECDEPISLERRRGGTRTVDQTNGKPARTLFRLLETFGDGTSLLEAVPLTGRTNQIRIHLWSLEMPVFGDPSYLPDHEIAAAQTLGVNDPPMCLHAWELAFEHPLTGERASWRSPMPDWSFW